MVLHFFSALRLVCLAFLISSLNHGAREKVKQHLEALYLSQGRGPLMKVSFSREYVNENSMLGLLNFVGSVDGETGPVKSAERLVE